MTPKEKAIQIIEISRGDDLYRAKAAFRGMSEQDMQKQYGQSGKTRQEILDRYVKQEQEFEAALAWAKNAS